MRKSTDKLPPFDGRLRLAEPSRRYQVRRASDIDSLRARLVAWFRGAHRDLPWRRIRDPYAMSICEIMLQQTRVETVIPYFERFMERFPTVRALAAADEDDVLTLWSGLGYYARGRNLHRAARAIALHHGGDVPRDEEELLDLPGIGRYTAGAIRSIAFGEPAAILDGNVTRVLSRHFALEGDPRSRDNSGRLWALAANVALGEAPGDANQALMELGATVCTPATPRCDACPILASCAAHARGEELRFPETPPRREPKRVFGCAALVLRGAPLEVLMTQRPRKGLLGGLWDLPRVERDATETIEAAFDRMSGEIGVAITAKTRVAQLTHLFTHRRLELDVFRCELGRRGSRLPANVRWIALAALDGLPLSKLAARALTSSGVVLPKLAATRLGTDSGRRTK